MTSRKENWQWKVILLDIENGYSYYKKAQNVDNFSELLIMVSLNIAFQTIYEKCVSVRR